MDFTLFHEKAIIHSSILAERMGEELENINCLRSCSFCIRKMKKIKNRKKKTSVYIMPIAVMMLLLAGCGGDASISANRYTASTEVREQNVEEKDTEQNPIEIFCWGDSLTFGEGGDGVTYPQVLEELSGCAVYNYGVQGEVARQIGIRAGAYEMTTSAFLIPEDTASVSLSLNCEGEDPIMFRLGDAGLNPCQIAGVEGNLSYHTQDGQYYFTRAEMGEAVNVPENTNVVSYASTHKADENDIVILFAGTNDRPSLEDTGALIRRQKEILSELGSERYLVVGLTCKDMVPQVQEVNEVLSETYGNHFYDARDYFLKQGLEDAEITASEQDKKDIESGEIPASLRVDVVHGTSTFYRLLGEQIYAKLLQQGYL